MKLKYYLILVFVLVYSSNLNAQNNLDKITGLSSTSASVAYSLRQLSSNYFGPLVRIKVVNSFYDVYPDASTTKFSLSSKISAAIGTYDAAVATAGSNALSNIITGSTDATVAIWYDQSGNGVHVLRSNPNAKIITAGSINTIFGQPTIYFSGSNSSLGSSNTVDYSALSGATVNAVAQNVATTSGFAGIIGTAVASPTYPGYNISYSSPSSGYGSDGDGGFYGTSVTSTDIKVVTNIFIFNTKNRSKIYVNKELKTNVAVTSSGNNTITHSSSSKILIGVSRFQGSTTNFIGNISEAILFPSQLSDAVRNPLETNQSQTYFGPAVTIASSASGAVCEGTSVTFTATTYNFSGTPTYQWYKNSVAINGETSATYSTTALNNNDVIKVIAGGATSNDLIAIITAGPSAVISVSGDGCINKTTLSTTSGLTSYVWYKDNVIISGITTNTIIPNASGDYKVVVSSGTCTNTSIATTIYTCGRTAIGKMLALTNAVSLISSEGGANFGTAIDDMGRITNTTGLTTTVGTIDGSTAVLGGVISSTNGIASSVGVIYSTDLNFGTYSTATIQTNVAAGTYTSTISGLSSSTPYYAKSFIVNKAGTSYGTVISFTTPTVVPTKVAVTRASVGTTYGALFTTQPQVTIQTASGSTVSNSSETVTASISSGGALIGTKSVNAVSGVATFTNLGLKGMNGTAYTITYTVSGLTTATESVTPTGSWSLGSTGPGGGKVFYAATSGFACGPTLSETCYYLEVAPASANSLIDWSSPAYDAISVPGGTPGTAIGSGYPNTMAIIGQGNGTNSAAGYAQAYRGNGLSDWYLGTRLELYQIYLNRANVITGTSVEHGFAGQYWASEQDGSTHAWNYLITTNGGPWSDRKEGPNGVRPIRSF